MMIRKLDDQSIYNLELKKIRENVFREFVRCDTPSVLKEEDYVSLEKSFHYAAVQAVKVYNETRVKQEAKRICLRDAARERICHRALSAVPSEVVVVDQIFDKDIFKVEKILDSRLVKGRKMYLVLWEGYSLKHATWEPASNILDKSLVVSYNKEMFR